MKKLSQFVIEKLKIKKSLYQYFPTDLSELQQIIIDKCNNIKDGYIDLTDVDVSSIDEMFYLFGTDNDKQFTNKNDIKTIDVTGWNVSNVKDMDFIFNALPNLIEIKGLDTWDVSNVTSMKGFFYDCTNLKSIKGIENFKFNEKLKSLSQFFAFCDSLEEINVNNWDVSNVSNFSIMFLYCRKLNELNLGNWKTKNAVNLRSMFETCDNLKKIIGLDNWDISNVKSTDSMFKDCKNLESLPGIENWDVSNITHASQMFLGCKKLKGDLSNWKFDKNCKLKNIFVHTLSSKLKRCKTKFN